MQSWKDSKQADPSMTAADADQVTAQLLVHLEACKMPNFPGVQSIDPQQLVYCGIQLRPDLDQSKSGLSCLSEFWQPPIII